MEIKLIPKDLQEIVNNSPVARTINQEEQGRYEEACKSYGEKAKSTLNVESNLFKVLLLNQIGIRTATLPELGIILESNPDFLKDYYEDAPLVVLRSNGDSHAPNDYIAKQLAKELKIKNFKTPYVINGLKIKEDKDSSYGLSFDTKDAQIIKASELNHSNHQKTFSKLDERGMPIFDEKATKTLYARDNGVSRLFLDRYLNLVTWGEFLADSGDTGRVVVVSGVAKNFGPYLDNLKQARNKEIAKVDNRYAKALSILKSE